MTITLKDMKLIFTIWNEEEKWTRRVEDMDGNLIWTAGEEKCLYDQREEEYLNEWETQMRALECWNIVEHERVYV